MGKLIQFRPLRVVPKSNPRPAADECPKCQHKRNVHITHPNGVINCAARGCECEIRPGR